MQGSIGCDFKIPEYFKLTIFQHTSGCAFSGTQLIQWLLHPAMQGHVLIGFVKKCEKLLVHFSYWMEWKRWYFKRQKCFWSSSITLFCLTFSESADTVQFRMADSLKKCLVSFFPAVQFVPRMAGYEATVVPCRPPKLKQFIFNRTWFILSQLLLIYLLQFILKVYRELLSAWCNQLILLLNYSFIT